jgi:hypothetical protein
MPVVVIVQHYLRSVTGDEVSGRLDSPVSVDQIPTEFASYAAATRPESIEHSSARTCPSSIAQRPSPRHCDLVWWQRVVGADDGGATVPGDEVHADRRRDNRVDAGRGCGGDRTPQTDHRHLLEPARRKRGGGLRAGVDSVGRLIVQGACCEHVKQCG